MIRPILPNYPLPIPIPTSMQTELAMLLGKLTLMLGLALFIVWLMLRTQRKNGITPDLTVCLLLTVSVGLFTFLPYGITLESAKGMILFGILLFASASDIYKREVPDCIWIMITILALVVFETSNLPSMLLGAAVVFLPQLLLAMIRPNKAVGGADIKISTSAAFLLGTEKGILALIIGLSLAVIVMLIMRKVKNTNKNDPFPLVPFLSVGIMVSYLV